MGLVPKPVAGQFHPDQVGKRNHADSLKVLRRSHCGHWFDVEVSSETADHAILQSGGGGRLLDPFCQVKEPIQARLE
jgi:hypothetical protein